MTVSKLNQTLLGNDTANMTIDYAFLSSNLPAVVSRPGKAAPSTAVECTITILVELFSYIRFEGQWSCFRVIVCAAAQHKLHAAETY